MPLLINTESGLAENLDPKIADSSLKAGTHEIPLNDSEGNPVSAPIGQAQELVTSGEYAQPSQEQLDLLHKEGEKQRKYGTTTEQLKTALQEGASAATFGASKFAQRVLGDTPEEIESRKEVNPKSAVAGSIAGLVGSAFLPGVGEAAVAGDALKAAKAAEKLGTGTKAAVDAAKAAYEATINPISAQSIMSGLGKKAVEKIGIGGAKEGLMAQVISKAGAGAVQGAVENALFQAGDETGKWLAGDPHQSMQSAIANIGLGTAIGVGAGGVIGSVSPLWEAASSSKVGQLIEDFKSRAKQRLNNPNPSEALHEEVSNWYNSVKGHADDVYGAGNLKESAIKKLMPEMSPEIGAQMDALAAKTEKAIESLGDDPLARKLSGALDNFKQKISSEVDPLTLKPTKSPTPDQLFSAAQDLKQQLQEWGKFNKMFVPVAEENFRNVSKGLGFEFRNALEDSGIWGQAGKVQQDINSAFKEFIGPLKDFQKRFTTKVNDELVVDPAKINTYVNQLGKPQAEIKKEMMSAFRDASDKYLGAIDSTYKKIGAESPISPFSLHHVNESLSELSTGAKLADKVIDKGLIDLAGAGIGSGIGAGVGSLVGHPGIGALIGNHALSPFFKSVLPTIIKPLLEKSANPSALKSAVDLAMHAINAENTMNKAIKGVFKGGRETAPKPYEFQPRQATRLDKYLDSLKQKPAAMIDIGGGVGHYAQAHGVALTSAAAGAVGYLQTIKPNTSPQSPLDSQRVPSASEKARYDSALQIADSPQTVLHKIANGTLNLNDVKDLGSMYPGYYQRAKQKLGKEVIEHSSKGKTIPYKTRMSISLFMGQPLDSTMSCNGIMAAQPMPVASSALQSMPAPKGMGSMKNITKMPSAYATPEQSREMARTNRR
jgi:hypothetical protein